MIETERLTLRPYTPILAAQIADGAPRDPHWAADFPFDGDQSAARMYLQAGAPDGPWVPYVIVLREATVLRGRGRFIGGVGFHGQPDGDGTVEIGYGLAPSARGHGYAVEAARALLELARGLGAKRAVAGTEADNLPSQRVIAALGMSPTEPTDELRYALDLH